LVEVLFRIIVRCIIKKMIPSRRLAETGGPPYPAYRSGHYRS
jgi:hypothetical protein